MSVYVFKGYWITKSNWLARQVNPNTWLCEKFHLNERFCVQDGLSLLYLNERFCVQDGLSWLYLNERFCVQDLSWSYLNRRLCIQDSSWLYLNERFCICIQDLSWSRDRGVTLRLHGRGGGGGDRLVTRYWWDTRHLFLLTFYISKSIGGTYVPPLLPLLPGPWAGYT